MPSSIIPIELSYSTTGKKTKRNVLGVICPTVYNQNLSYFKVDPIYVSLGDVEVNWEATSPGFETLPLNYLKENS